MTLFSVVYDAFFTLITDDMYLEITPEATRKDVKELLMASILTYEFPEHVLTFKQITNELLEEVDVFNADLTLEEINILAQGMVPIWYQRQINSVEKTRQITSGADFKISSQAAHLRQLQNEYDKAIERHWHLQALASRRRVTKDGTRYETAFDLFVKPMSITKKRREYED